MKNEAFVIRHITRNDIQSLTRNFARYNKKQEMYERLWREHELGKRVTLVAITGQEAVGYTNLLWQSRYKPFRENDIPEISNMHVIDEYQQQGIGTALIKEAERIATDHNKKTIGIGVDIKPKKTPSHNDSTQNSDTNPTEDHHQKETYSTSPNRCQTAQTHPRTRIALAKNQKHERQGKVELRRKGKALAENSNNEKKANT